MKEAGEAQAYQVAAAANSALELAAEGFAIFEERRPDIVGYPRAGAREFALRDLTMLP